MTTYERDVRIFCRSEPEGDLGPSPHYVIVPMCNIYDDLGLTDEFVAWCRETFGENDFVVDPFRPHREQAIVYVSEKSRLLEVKLRFG